MPSRGDRAAPSGWKRSSAAQERAGVGNWAVVGPGFKRRLPRGVIRVKSPYDRVWIVGRTYVRGPHDLGNVHRIEEVARHGDDREADRDHNGAS